MALVGDPPPSTLARRTYIDAARGIAVLLMIEAHTLDAWTKAAAKHGPAFRRATILGGFAAPAFLWLAGIALVLAADRTVRRTGQRRAAVETICKRGLEIFVLAFLFRLQAFIVSPGSHPISLFRVDILNILGPSVVAAAVMWGLMPRPSHAVLGFAAAAVGVAMSTPVVRMLPSVDHLPLWLQWHIRPAGEYTTFTTFPWAGFVFAGAACGVLLAAAPASRKEAQLHSMLAAVGAGVIALGVYTSTRPSIYAQSSFWTSSPTWFAIRVGILMVGLTLLYALTRIGDTFKVECPQIVRFGRRSLFVYWIHVELVYGYSTWPLRGRLPLWGTAIACVVFMALMYRAVCLRDRLAESWRNRQRLKSVGAATA